MTQDYNCDVYIPFHTDWTRFRKLLTSGRAGTWEAEKLEISELTVSVADVSHGGGLLGLAVGIMLAHLVSHLFELPMIVTLWLLGVGEFGGRRRAVRRLSRPQRGIARPDRGSAA